MTSSAPGPERWRKIDEVFQAAMELSPEERAAFLDRTCAGDAKLREEVEELLRLDQGSGSFIDEAIRGEAGRIVATSAEARPGRRLGPYRVVRALGHGGMGTVYLAVRDDDQYRKEVAIKLLRGGLETEEAVARFRDERQILAALEHPGVVRLLDGGSTEEGLPFLVMEHVEGVPITQYCEEHGLSVRERVRLFRQVCAAVQYAHQRLVVHRDIKPRNILVGADGTPKLLDFGIAKLLGPAGEREAQTRTGMHVLTPEYGSPEQARGEAVSTATDVYSLGTVLYELLTGVRAHRFDSESAVQMLRTICEVDPPRPSTVAPPDRRRALHGDLDNIVLKALHKEPGRRYASVEQLSEDLRRHLEGLPVTARAGTWAYRAGKFVRRRRGLVAAAVIVFVTLISATVVSLQQARRAQRRFADVRRLANSLLFEVDERIQGLEGSTAARELIVSRALEYLDRLAAEAGDDPALSRELATAYIKIADIQANPLVPNLGRPRDGIENYRKAEAILGRLAALGHDDPATRWSLAGALQGIGSLHLMEGRFGPARTSLLEATRVVESIPKTGDFNYEVAVIGYLALFETEDRAGSLPAVAEYARKCFEVATEWARTDPSPKARYWVGIGHDMRGHAAAQGADPEAAVREYRQARELFEALVAEQPENATYRRELSVADHLLAQSSSGITDASVWAPGLGDWKGAEDALRRALVLGERQAERDPEDQRAAQRVADGLVPLAVTIAARAPAESIPLFQRARDIYARLPASIRQSPYSSEWFIHCSMAEPLAKLGRRADSLAAIREGLAITERDAGAEGASFDRRSCLLTCRYQVARARRALGEPAVAEQLDEVARGLRGLIASQPARIPSYIGLVETLRLLAEIRPGERCALYQEAVAAWRSWPGTPTSFSRLRQAELEKAVAGCQPGR